MIAKYFNYLIWDIGMFAGTLALIHIFYAILYLRAARRTGPPSWQGFRDFVFPSTTFKHAGIDLAVFLLGKIAWKPVFLKILGFVAFEAAVFAILGAMFGKHALAVPESWAVLTGQFLITILVADCAFYWIHRILHENRWLWGLHRVHHSAETMTFLTVIRQHPLEILIEMTWIGFWGGGTAAILAYASGSTPHPLMPTLMLCFSVCSESMSKLQHSHLPTSFGWFDRILHSGRMHQIHHSTEPRHHDRNYGANLSIFDWIFGTIWLPNPQETFRLGLGEGELGKDNPHQSVTDIYTEPLTYIGSMTSEHEPYRT
jgi:sterol desaturase/sphingolipid hydroxylase (fatty acid hydroxylase superfamily)